MQRSPKRHVQSQRPRAGSEGSGRQEQGAASVRPPVLSCSKRLLILAGIIIYFRGKAGNSAPGPWSWPLHPFPQLQNQGTGDTLRAHSGAGPPHSDCSNHRSGDNTGQPSDLVRERGVMKKGNAPRRNAPTKHATLQRARGTKKSHPGRGPTGTGSSRLGSNSRTPRGPGKALREEAPHDGIARPRRRGTGKKGERPARIPTTPHS